MSKTVVDSEILDLVVFYLSLISTNSNYYLIEAYRLLRVGGLLKIAELASGRQEDKFIILKKKLMLQDFNYLAIPG